MNNGEDLFESVVTSELTEQVIFLCVHYLFLFKQSASTDIEDCSSSTSVDLARQYKEEEAVRLSEYLSAP